MTSDAPAPSLRCLQEWMAARILGPAAGESPDPGAAFDRWLQVPSGAAPAQRLQVYARGYPSRVFDALAETYSAVAASVGADAFAALAARYTAAARLTSYNLNDAGAELSGFLAADPLAVEHPFLPDLARLEWCVAVAFHAEQRPPLDPRQLGWDVEDWAAAVLQFQPAVAVVSSPWPLLDLWEHHDADCAGSPQHVVVRRSDLIVRCEAVAAEEARCLQQLLAGQTLGAVAQQLESDGTDPAEVMRAFGRWIGAGMIVGAVRGGIC